MKPYYEDDAVTIYHGDCEEIMPSLADTGAVVLTDPPYGIGVRYGKGFDDARGDYWTWMRARVDQMRAVAPVLVFTHRVKALQELRGWDWIGAWVKPLSTGTRVGNSPVLPCWEPIFMYGIHTLGTQGVNFTQDVFTFNPERSQRHRGIRGRAGWASDQPGNDHPVPKPETLCRVLLRAFGQGGGTVIDPFAGSGTTLRVAKDLGRRAIGIEIEERYCEIAARRMGQDVLFGEAA